MSNVVDIARSYIGKVKYVFGAQDPDGGKSDCSGFTMTVFKKAGYTIPRTTGGVWTDDSLENVSKDQLQSGDLILFKNTYSSGYKDGVSHIGIYTGNGMFVHCGTDGVREESLNTTYWINHYLGAKRVSGASNGMIDSITNSSSSKLSSIGLEWWGDIVVVVLCLLLMLTGVTMLVLGVKGTANNVIKEVL